MAYAYIILPFLLLLYIFLDILIIKEIFCISHILFSFTTDMYMPVLLVSPSNPYVASSLTRDHHTNQTFFYVLLWIHPEWSIDAILECHMMIILYINIFLMRSRVTNFLIDIFTCISRSSTPYPLFMFVTFILYYLPLFPPAETIR